MESNINVRPGTPDDLPRVHELVVELAIFEKEPNAVETTVESMFADAFGESPVFSFLVAENIQGGIVGTSIFYWHYSTWKGKRLYLEDLVVTEKARGRGFGKALFHKTMEYGIEHGCTGMMWQVLDWNEPAIEFYRSYDSHLDGEWVNCILSRKQMQVIVARSDR